MHIRSVVMVAVLALCPGISKLLSAQQAPAPNQAAVHMVVTAEPKHGTEVPSVNRDDVMVYEGHDRDRVLEWIPAQGDHAALELFILIDDESSASLGSQLEDIRNFINTQPASSQVGVAYMQDGIARIVQNLTADHALAAKSLRLPLGSPGANGNPYFAVSDLVKRWPASSARHQVLMISDGIDRYYGSGDPDDPYVDQAAESAIRAGIQVSAIYMPGAGHFAHSYWQSYWGQIYLSQIADKTGGESYYIGFSGPPVSFAPYLQDLERRLGHQYLLSFLPKPQKKSGWQRVRLHTEVPNVDLVSAGEVYVSIEP
jgi:hypothetical protein